MAHTTEHRDGLAKFASPELGNAKEETGEDNAECLVHLLRDPEGLLADRESVANSPSSARHRAR